MHHSSLFLCLIYKLVLISADTYTVKIGSEQHVNLIDSRFLSFTIDPKYLFSNDKYKSKECICMASSLTPAYIRIAGPSTALISYHNSSISIEEEPFETFQPKRSRFQSFFSENLARIDEALHRPREEGRQRRTKEKEEGRFKRNQEKLEVSHSEWRQFVQWAKNTGFDLVFAVSNEDKTQAGMWAPDLALSMLTVAEKAGVGDIYWQLGYECNNQSIEEYLNDMETLRVIIETFPQGRSGRWKVVGGDVTNCLHQESKSDFKDYVTLSSDMMDAVLLNGNSTTSELARMSERDRQKLLKLLSHSTTPLWLAESPWTGGLSEASRAADWLTSLGHAARNGFSVHYRELVEEEMYQPTLSYYMALLYKNLVGEKVLNVEMEPDQAIMFAHCTSLRHKEVPGAVTLYGVNMDEEPARFSIKLAKKEEGGDIMQFVIGHDKNGNVVVNGRTMHHEGDLKPVVKRVRPYKTLLINLPPKSFGFWVLANTKVAACFADEKYNETEDIEDAVSLSEESVIGKLKSKRSLNGEDFEEYSNSGDISVDFCDENDYTGELKNEYLKNRVNDINNDLMKVKTQFKLKSQQKIRTKRQTSDGKPDHKIRKFIRHGLKIRNSKSEPELKPRGLLGNILHSTKQDLSKLLNSDKLQNIRKITIFNKNKLAKRQSDNKPKTKRKEKTLVSQENKNKNIHRNAKPVQYKNTKEKLPSLSKERIEEFMQSQEIKRKSKPPQKHIKDEENLQTEEKIRTRRNTKDQVDLSAENEVDINGEDNVKLWKMLRKIHKQFKDLSAESDDYTDDIDIDVDDSDAETFIKRIPQNKNDDVDLGDDTTFIKTTVYSLLRVISDLNTNLSRFWNGMRILD